MIEPNEVYIINKLNFASQANVLAKICTTLNSVKEPIDPYIFLEYVGKGLAFGRCIILVAFNEAQELNGCMVILLKNNPVKGKILWVEWAWTDGKDLKLGKRFIEKTEDLARQLGASRVAGAMTRGFKAVSRKYGYEEAYRVMEKIIEKEVKENVEKD